MCNCVLERLRISRPYLLSVIMLLLCSIRVRVGVPQLNGFEAQKLGTHTFRADNVRNAKRKEKETEPKATIFTVTATQAVIMGSWYTFADHSRGRRLEYREAQERDFHDNLSPLVFGQFVCTKPVPWSSRRIIQLIHGVMDHLVWIYAPRPP